MKPFLKRLILTGSILAVSPLILLTRIAYLFKSTGFFNSLSCAASLIPGKLGNYLRVAYYIGTLNKMSPDVIIGFGSFFSQSSAKIGNNVSIGAYCILGNVRIEDNVLIASRVSIPSGKYQHESPLLAKNNDNTAYERITIGHGTWIGEGAIIIADVGKNCIIGSGSVVTRSIPDNTIAVGNPARPKEITATS